jgi:enamine deaminase RidA (YjgF/YER057c/UK114 family)
MRRPVNRRPPFLAGALLLIAAGCTPPGGGTNHYPVPEVRAPAYLNPGRVPSLEGFSTAVKVGSVVYVSGQVAVDSENHLVGPGDLRAQIRQAFSNVAAVVRAANGVPADLVKLTMYVVDSTAPAIGILRDVTREYFPADSVPALTVVGVASLPLPDLLVALDGTAILRGLVPDRTRDRGP